MFKVRPIVMLLAGAGLLQSCAAPPAKDDLALQPVLRVRHSADQTAASYYQLARYHQRRGEFDLAVSAYTYSITLDSRQLEPRNALAALLAQQGKLGEAKSVLLQVIRDFPGVAHPYNNLGYVYYLQGDYDAAATTLRRALELDSANERARNNLNLATAALAAQRGHAATELALAPASEVKNSVPSDAPVAPAGEAAPPEAPAPAAAPAATTAATTAAAPTPTLEARALAAPPAAIASAASKVEIANGNGVAGMAKRVGRVLGQHGIAVSRITNERPYRRQTTEIQYRAGHREVAEQLKSAMQGHAAVALASNLSVRSDVRLVLGKDAIAHMALIERTAGMPRWAIGGGSN